MKLGVCFCVAISISNALWTSYPILTKQCQQQQRLPGFFASKKEMAGQ
jgi:hypothetical protein